MATLTINRPKNYVGMIQKMKISIGENEVGILANGESMTIDIPTGTHELVCKAGKLEKPARFNFTINEGETKILDVGFNHLISYLIIIFTILLISILSFFTDGKLTTQQKISIYLTPSIIALILSYKNGLYIKQAEIKTSPR